MATKMASVFARARTFLTRRQITQTKNFCEKAEEWPSQKDFLSKSVGGDPYYMMPFQFRNHVRFTAVFLIYCGIAFWAPPMIVHFQLYKRQLG